MQVIEGSKRFYPQGESAPLQSGYIEFTRYVPGLNINLVDLMLADVLLIRAGSVAFSFEFGD